MLNWNQLVQCSLLYFGGCVFREETRFGSLPISILLFRRVDRPLWLSVIFKHKGAHLKGLNANLISYMKQSWFIFPELFFLSLQTTFPTHSPHPPQHTPRPGWNHAFQHAVKGMGKCSVDGCHDPPAPNPPTHPPTHPFFLFLQSISAHSRCLAEPKDSSDIEREVLGTSFILCSHNCHSSSSGQSCTTHLIISSCCVWVGGCLFLFSVDGLKDLNLSLYKHWDWINRSSRSVRPSCWCVGYISMPRVQFFTFACNPFPPTGTE